MINLNCPVCGSLQLRPFLQRHHVPVHQNILMMTPQAARAITRGDIEFVACEACGFIFNRTFDFSLLNYGQDYDNTQSCSTYFDSYLDGLVHDMVANQGVSGCTVVEVGCGKGHFLRKLVGHPEANNKGYGFDPSYVGPVHELDGKLQFRDCYYDSSCTDIEADVVVCRHVIEHVPLPLQLLQSVRGALRASPKARVFFETPCAEWILSNKIIWDFFYEHCSLFTKESLGLAFRSSGFLVERVEHIFGGQYLWLEARVSDEVATPHFACNKTIALAREYEAVESGLRDKWSQRLKELGRHSKVALWGAGAKGATFANLVDPSLMLIDCVVDLNTNKHGRFIPGTGHPIVAPQDLSRRGVGAAILMNPNYRNENEALLREAGIEIELINWIDQ